MMQFAMHRSEDIESYISNSHIGFDPDYEVIKKTRPASNKTPDERMAYLVIIVVQEGNNKQFRVCLMSQNRVVVENKNSYPVPRISPSSCS